MCEAAISRRRALWRRLLNDVPLAAAEPTRTSTQAPRFTCWTGYVMGVKVCLEKVDRGRGDRLALRPTTTVLCIVRYRNAQRVLAALRALRGTTAEL